MAPSVNEPNEEMRAGMTVRPWRLPDRWGEPSGKADVHAVTRQIESASADQVPAFMVKEFGQTTGY